MLKIKKKTIFECVLKKIVCIVILLSLDLLQLRLLYC